MRRNVLLTLIPIAACVGSLPAQASATDFPVTGTIAPACIISGTIQTINFSSLTNAAGATIVLAPQTKTLPVTCNGAGTSVTVKRGNLVAQDVITVTTPFTNIYAIKSVSVASGSTAVTDQSSIVSNNLSSGTSSITALGAFTTLTVTATPDNTQSGTLVASAQYTGTIVIDLTSKN